MIMQPGEVTHEVVEQARAEVTRKKTPPPLASLRFETYHEGLSPQIMYIGPYADGRPDHRPNAHVCQGTGLRTGRQAP